MSWHLHCNPLTGEPLKEITMARGSKKAYTSKQKRQARHIEEGAKKQGRSAKTAARIAWATVNKQDGGGKKKPRKGGRKGGRSRSK
jgi:hypothetical protein